MTTIQAPAAAQGGQTALRRGYVICAMPRSGSNYLCQLLESTGVLGRPAEYFNAVEQRGPHPDYPDDPEQQLQQIPKYGVTPNGVYGLKIFPYQFQAVEATRWIRRLPRLSFVHLERDDSLGQATPSSGRPRPAAGVLTASTGPSRSTTARRSASS